MIRSVQTENFRMLPANAVDLGPFHVLVGQNATGKSTFLSALQFVADILSKGVTAAVRAMAPSFYDLCFNPSEPVALAIEVAVGNGVNGTDEALLRYEIQLGITDELRILHERLFLLPPETLRRPMQQSLFSKHPARPTIHTKAQPEWRTVVSKTQEGKDHFEAERTEWSIHFRLGTDRAALGGLPEDPERFPLAIAARNYLRDGVRMLELDSHKLRLASPPGESTRLALDGSNLPHVVRELEQRDRVLFEQWVEHLATGVGGLTSVHVRERPEDKHLVLEAEFAGQHLAPVPSWLLSDGTLRLMALTLVSFAASGESRELYMVEEPENGLHPLAIETVFKALSLPPSHVQVLCATHSPVLLAQVGLEQALVFRRLPDGRAAIRRGNEITELKDWVGRKNLTDLFATGVLA